MMITIFDQGITRQQFIERYEKLTTRKSVIASLKAFDHYRETEHGASESVYFEDMKKLDEQRLYMELDRMVQFWKSGGKNGKPLAPKSVSLYFTFTRAWMRVNGIRTFDDLINLYVKMPKVLKEKSVPMTHDIALKIHNALKPKYAVYFDFCCYSGMRLDGEALHVQVRDVFLNEDPIRIRVRSEIAKTGVERTTFVPVSMRAELAQLIGTKKPTDMVFDFTYMAYYKHFSRIRNMLGLVDKRQNGRNYQMIPYKTRKYAKTNISAATDSDFSEHILGHENGVKGTYYEAEDDVLGKMYKKAIPNIMLSKELVYKEKLETALESASRVKELELNAKKQQAQIDRLQDMIKSKSAQ